MPFYIALEVGAYRTVLLSSCPLSIQPAEGDGKREVFLRWLFSRGAHDFRRWAEWSLNLGRLYANGVAVQHVA